MKSIARSAFTTRLAVGVRFGGVVTDDIGRPHAASAFAPPGLGELQALVGWQRTIPGLLELGTRRLIVEGLVAGQHVRKRSHVACALDVALSPQRIHADAPATDVARQQSQIRAAHHPEGAVGVLGYAQPVEDHGLFRLPVEPCGGLEIVGRNSCDRFHALRRILAHRLGKLLELFGSGGDELFVVQMVAKDYVRQSVEQGHVGAGAQRQPVICKPRQSDLAVDRRRSSAYALAARRA